MGGLNMSIILTDEQIKEIIQSTREFTKRLKGMSTEDLQNALMKINFEELKNTNFDPNEFGEVIQKLKQK
jgi:hypothetical protein